MPRYGPVPDEREADLAALLGYAFRPREGPFDGDDLDERREQMYSFGEPRGLFDGEDLLVACKHHWFEARLRGRWLPLAGLSAVASPPEHRRRGLVRELVTESLAEYRERDQPLAALWPFERSFYARLGWATANRYTTATVDPEALAPAAASVPDDAGTFRRVDGDDRDRLDPVYEAWLDGYNLATRRSADWWRDRVFQHWETDLYGYCWERRDGEPRGYLVYGVEEGDDGRRLRVYEAAYADHEAYLHLLRFCRNHDSQVSSIRLDGPGHDVLLDVVADHETLEVTVGAGPMVRIVDVGAALEGVPYPDVDRARVVLDVSDPLVEWNEDNFEVTVEDGAATVRRADAAADARVGVGTLSQLLVGYHPVERARRVGDLAVGSPDAAATLDALFPAADVFLPEGF